ALMITGAIARSESGLASVSSRNTSLPYTARRSVADCWALKTPLPIHTTTKATKRKVATSPTISTGSTFASHVDVDDLAQPQDAAHHQDQTDADGDPAEGFLKKRRQILPVADAQEAGHRKGQRPEHEGGDPTLRSQCPDLTAQPVAGQHGVGHRLQHLGEIPSDFPLDLDGHDRPFEVLRLSAVRDALHRLGDTTPQSRLGDRSTELPSSRVGGLGSDSLHCLKERVTGAKRGGQEHQSVGELLLELALFAIPRPADETEGEEDDQREHDQSTRRP